MADITTISAELRDRAGKGAARATRRAGRPITAARDPKNVAESIVASIEEALIELEE